MTPSGAHKAVVISGGLLASYTFVSAREEGLSTEQTFKRLWGIGVITLGLAIAADFVPEIAAPFAILILIAMVAKNQGALGRFLGTSAAN